MLKNSLHWRRLHHVGSILETWNPSENLLQYYPGGWHHYDKGNEIRFSFCFMCLPVYLPWVSLFFYINIVQMLFFSQMLFGGNLVVD